MTIKRHTKRVLVAWKCLQAAKRKVKEAERKTEKAKKKEAKAYASYCYLCNMKQSAKLKLEIRRWRHGA